VATGACVLRVSNVATCVDAPAVLLVSSYLLSQWLSPLFNQRRDEHGGSIANRCAYPLAVIAAVREAVGPSFTVIVKVCLTCLMPRRC
jgi:2,4-dienoyl-CoA reductase (NADPH2)